MGSVKGLCFCDRKIAQREIWKTYDHVHMRPSRPPSASQERKRYTSTRGTCCPFSVLGKQSLDHASWVLRHRPDSRFAVHNHEPSWHRSAHPVHRTLSETDRSSITSMVRAGISPKDIRTYIRQNSSALASQQDIYNRIAESRRELSEGQSAMQALTCQLDKEGFWSRTQVDEDGRVTAVIFAHPESLAHLKAYPELLFLDCTYKTNKYEMPLLDIIGVDACQRSFCVAFAFLSGENEEDYIWALGVLRSFYELAGARWPAVILTDRCLACMNAVSRCFPTATSLLCLWHANKAVLRHCMPSFVRYAQGAEAHQTGLRDWNNFFSHWHAIVRACDEETYEARVRELEEQYKLHHCREIDYIKSVWLDPYKEKLVKAWVNQRHHFGNVVTSRVEGIHGLLKSHLKKSTLDLFQAWRAIKNVLLNQLAESKLVQAQQQMRLPIELSRALYSSVRGWVSHEALRKVEEQRKLLSKGNLPCCTGAFTRSYGLPCAHALERILEQSQILRIEHFHSHWHLLRSGNVQLVFEPVKPVDRATRISSRSRSGTRREPSMFEVVESIAQRRARPTCSRCYTEGHTMASKICPRKHADQARIRQQSASETTATEPVQQAQGTQTARTDDLAGLRHDDPRAIYQRYTAAREAWCKTQPSDSARTNLQYRKAMGLPLRYSKASYDWCLDWKQMTKCCQTPDGVRKWTREEMMAYLDWDKSENDRIDEKVADEIIVQSFSGRRGVDDIWSACEKDSEERQAFYNVS